MINDSWTIHYILPFEMSDAQLFCEKTSSQCNDLWFIVFRYLNEQIGVLELDQNMNLSRSVLFFVLFKDN